MVNFQNIASLIQPAQQFHPAVQPPPAQPGGSPWSQLLASLLPRIQQQLAPRPQFHASPRFDQRRPQQMGGLIQSRLGRPIESRFPAQSPQGQDRPSFSTPPNAQPGMFYAQGQSPQGPAPQARPPMSSTRTFAAGLGG